MRSVSSGKRQKERAAKPQLTKCELEVMTVVWQKGQATVQDVVDSLNRTLAYTTVMTTLNILAEKRRVVRRRKQGRAYVYEPTVSRQEVCRSMVGELKEYLFGGSVKSLMLSLIDPDSVSPADLEELKSAIRSLEGKP
jgi:predicted transcriptional regulator